MNIPELSEDLTFCALFEDLNDEFIYLLNEESSLPVPLLSI